MHSLVVISYLNSSKSTEFESLLPKLKKKKTVKYEIKNNNILCSHIFFSAIYRLECI